MQKINHYQYLMNKDKYDKINDFKKNNKETVFDIYRSKMNNITNKYNNTNTNINTNINTNSLPKKKESIKFNTLTNSYESKQENIQKDFKSNIPNLKFKLPSIAEQSIKQKNDNTNKNINPTINEISLDELRQKKRQSIGNQTDFYKKSYEPDFRKFQYQNKKKSVYYTGNKKQRFNHYNDQPVKRGDNIGKRYEVKDKINQGAFGLIVSCYDHKNKENVAIKCPIKREYNQLMNIEKKIYQQIGGDNTNIINVKNYVRDSENNQEYLVMEKLGINLFQWIQRKRPTSQDIKKIVYQIFDGIRHLHNKNIVHADLKPENIVFTDDSFQKIKIVDLGNGLSPSELNNYSIIQTRIFRAPEVIMLCNRDKKIDIWSIGCIIAELVNRHPLFIGHTDNDQLFAYMEYLGVPPKNMISQSSNRHYFFDYNGNPKMPYNRKLNSKKLEDKIHDNDLLSLTKKCLSWDPRNR